MNPLMNPMMQIISEARQAQSNPNYVRDLLLKNGKINQETYDATQGMSASQMGAYMIDHGLLTHDAVNKMMPFIQQLQGMAR